VARVLDGVLLDVAPVALDAGFLGPKAADWLGAAAKGAPSAQLAFHLDPLSAFAETGVSPGPIEAHLISAATVAARLAEPYPKASLFLASGRTAHEAGGGEALELALAAAAALAYAKALTRAGLPVADAFERIVLGLTVDADYFLSLAKLRAARRVWARLAAACGAAAPARIEARSSGRMLTAADPWTNLIRLTAAAFAGAAGGADAIVLGAFTDALGAPTAFAAAKRAISSWCWPRKRTSAASPIQPAAPATWKPSATRSPAPPGSGSRRSKPPAAL
jgi:methylmalonyl-CoA mutase